MKGCINLRLIIRWTTIIRNSIFFFFSFAMRCTALSLNEIRTHLPRCHAQMPNSTMHLLQAFLSVGVLLRCRKDLSSLFFDPRPKSSRYFSRWFERVWSLRNLKKKRKWYRANRYRIGTARGRWSRIGEWKHFFLKVFLTEIYETMSKTTL